MKGKLKCDITALPEGIYLLRLHNGASISVMEVGE